MSCGDHHDTDCSEVLDRLFEYIDGELDAKAVTQIKIHMAECAPCLAEYDLDTAVKMLVARAGRAPAPDGLRARILETIKAARVSAE